MISPAAGSVSHTEPEGDESQRESARHRSGRGSRIPACECIRESPCAIAVINVNARLIHRVAGQSHRFIWFDHLELAGLP